MVRLSIFTVIVLATWVTPVLAESGNGRKLVRQKCQTCHGLDGIAKIPVAPHLAGESQIYLEVQLKAFRSGKRKHEMMSVIAKDLSNDDIRNVAKWYSAIKITAKIPD